MFQGRIGEPGMIGEKGVPGIAGPRVSFLLFLTLHVYEPMVLKQLILMFRDAEHNHAHKVRHETFPRMALKFVTYYLKWSIILSSPPLAVSET